MSIRLSDLTAQQIEIVQQHITVTGINPVDTLANRMPDGLAVVSLVALLTVLNKLYRLGCPMAPDQTYDIFVGLLTVKDPSNPILHSVEIDYSASTKKLPQPMLSTAKAYDVDVITKWLERILTTADSLGIARDTVTIKLTPKLDGFAAYDDGTTLYTRGDGLNGQDITCAFRKGLTVVGTAQRGMGPGEIVTRKSYFYDHLATEFKNSRNVQSAVVSESTPSASIVTALKAKACVFYPFVSLEHITVDHEALLEHFETLLDSTRKLVDFDIDGVVLEVTDARIKQSMGATRSTHRWQIAFKVNEDSLPIKVRSVHPQVSRNGTVTPVVLLDPTPLSGVTVSNVTGHHYANIKARNIGPGTILEVVRCGLVIPGIKSVVTPTAAEIPSVCPHCNTTLVWISVNLVCPNATGCGVQTENTIIHFFQTLGTVKGFGPVTVSELVFGKAKNVLDIYTGHMELFTTCEYNYIRSMKLAKELTASLKIEIEDWRFMAAFGLPLLGEANCERLLKLYSFEEIFSLALPELSKVYGFGDISAAIIVPVLQSSRKYFFEVLRLGFTLTSSKDSPVVDSVIHGKRLVFTGTMRDTPRADMITNAKALGAIVGNNVNSKTDMLIYGSSSGAVKINKAKELQIRTLTEQEYLTLLG